MKKENQNFKIILAGNLAAIVALGVMSTAALCQDRRADKDIQQDVQRFYRGELPSSPSDTGIMSIRFTNEEAVALQKLLSDEKSSARVLVERLAKSMATDDRDHIHQLNENLRATLQAGRYEDTNDEDIQVDNVLKTYQIFKTALKRAQTERQNKNNRNAAATQILLPVNQAQLHTR